MSEGLLGLAHVAAQLLRHFRQILFTTTGKTTRSMPSENLSDRAAHVWAQTLAARMEDCNGPVGLLASCGFLPAPATVAGGIASVPRVGRDDDPELLQDGLVLAFCISKAVTGLATLPRRATWHSTRCHNCAVAAVLSGPT